LSNLSITKLLKAAYSSKQRKLILDSVLVEQPLQITLLWHQDSNIKSVIFTITMRTPGQDKQLIAGLLVSDGIIRCISDIEYILADDHDSPSTNILYENQWQVKLTNGLIPSLIKLDQYQIRYSSCGLCGTTSLKSLELKQPPLLNTDSQWLEIDNIKKMPKNMRNQQALFFQTGGSHAAALFNQHCSLVDVQEDIGRHNALDKIIGAQLIRNQTINSLIRHCVVVSSRVSFEMVQKTIMAGIPVLIAVGAPSDLAISAAKRFDLTLIGFTSDKAFNVYHGDWRLLGEHNRG
jgi:FdhD protein